MSPGKMIFGTFRHFLQKNHSMETNQELANSKTEFTLDLPHADEVLSRGTELPQDELNKQAQYVTEQVSTLTPEQPIVQLDLQHELHPDIARALLNKGYSLRYHSSYNNVNGQITQRYNATVSLPQRSNTYWYRRPLIQFPFSRIGWF
jgi:ribosomal protein S13